MRAKGAMAPAQRFLLILFLLVALHTRVAWAAPWQAQGADEGDGNGYPAYRLDLGLHPLGLPAGFPRERYPAEGGKISPEPSELFRDILTEPEGGHVMDQEAVHEEAFPEEHGNSLPVPGGTREVMPDAVRQEIPAVPKTKSTARIIDPQDVQMCWIIGTAVVLAFLLQISVIYYIVMLLQWRKKMRDASTASEACLEAGGQSGTTERGTQCEQLPLPPASLAQGPPSWEPPCPTSLSPASLDLQQNLSSPVFPEAPPKEPPCHTTPLRQEPFPAEQSPLGAGAAPQTHPLGQFPLQAQDPAAPAEGMRSGGSSRTPRTPRGGRPDHRPRCPASDSGRHPQVTLELPGGCFCLRWSLLPRPAQLQKRLARGVSWFRRSKRQPCPKASPTSVRRESGAKRKTRGPAERRCKRRTKGTRKQ